MKKFSIFGSSNKKILFITYHFPPSNAVGGLRIVNFTKKLPLLGWEPSVLTINEKYIENKDSTRIDEIRAVKIIRTMKLPTLIQGYLKIKMLYRDIFNKNCEKGNKTAKIQIDSNVLSVAHNPGPENILQKLKRYFISIFLLLPDQERNWIIPATLKAIREIKREKINYIITSSPPVSVHLIGLLIKLLTGIKWIADFRDPWLNQHGNKRLHVNCKLSLKIEKWMFKKVIEMSDTVLTNTETLRSEFIKSFVNLNSCKFIYIPNGFDENIFKKYEHLKKYNKFTLTYAGGLYFGRTPEPVFKALEKLISEKKIDPDVISIKLVGSCQYINNTPTKDIAKSYGLNHIVDIIETIPHNQAIEIIKRSHIALLFAPAQPFQIPAKVYDYIGAETPILALTESGATADLVNSTSIGKVFNPNNIEGIGEYILNSIRQKDNSIEQAKNRRHEFEIESVTKKLADLLNKL